jgi:energy-coupling factor transporter transmembrane protein EcfT
MAYRYCFVLLDSARSLLESRQARLVGRLRASEQRRLAIANVGVLLARAMDLNADVELAMEARGFRGRARILDESGLRPLDWFYLCAAIAITALILLLAH